MVVTSPPYWSLRDYGVPGQLGLEPTPDEYVANMVAVFREVWRVMRDDGTLWLNLGDSYASSGGHREYGSSDNGVGRSYNSGMRANGNGLKPKDLVGIPWCVAFALQADGWYLRSDIIWSKPNPMPESVTDRPTRAHEYVFLLTKRERYYFDAEAVKEGVTGNTHSRGTKLSPPKEAANAADGNGHKGWTRLAPDIVSSRNIRTVWTIPTAPTPFAHFATYPPRLVEPCIKAGTSERGCCPVCGAGWARVVRKSGGTIGKGSWVDHNLDIEQGVSRRTGSKRGGADGDGSYQVKTLGWRPGCDCPPADPIPCTVFDPFAGSGTTLMVARKLGRRGVGCDLSYTYLHDIARKRLELDDLDDWRSGAAVEAAGDGYHDLPLFGEAANG
jgi:DNA modification methylase